MQVTFKNLFGSRLMHCWLGHDLHVVLHVQFSSGPNSAQVAMLVYGPVIQCLRVGLSRVAPVSVTVTQGVRLVSIGGGPSRWGECCLDGCSNLLVSLLATCNKAGS